MDPPNPPTAGLSSRIGKHFEIHMDGVCVKPAYATLTQQLMGEIGGSLKDCSGTAGQSDVENTLNTYPNANSRFAACAGRAFVTEEELFGPKWIQKSARGAGPPPSAAWKLSNS